MGDTNWVPQRRRFGAVITKSGRTHRVGINPVGRIAVPMHRLYCRSGALRVLASLRICLPVCHHGKTWLPSVRLQVGLTLIHTSPIFHHFVQLPVSSTESLFKHSLYIRQRGFARLEFFLLGDGAIALRDSLALLSQHLRVPSMSRRLAC